MKFNVKNAPNKAPEIYIYDEIGPDWLGMISDETVIKALDQIGDVREIVVRINSPGGDVFDGVSIFNVLRRTSDAGTKISVKIDGLAASAASLIAMAGDTIEMADNAMMMIHNAWAIAAGDKHELRHMGDVLEKIDANVLVNVYTARTGLPSEEIISMMDAETWLTAKQAVDKGLADRITPSFLPAANSARRPANNLRVIELLSDLARRRNGLQRSTTGQSSSTYASGYRRR